MTPKRCVRKAAPPTPVESGAHEPLDPVVPVEEKRADGTNTKKLREWKPAFLAAFHNSGNVRAACEAAGVNRPYVYEVRKKDPDFARAWDTALEEAIDILEAEARVRARAGSDVLLIFLLKAHRPEKYRDHYVVEQVKRYVGMTDAELTQYLTRRLVETDPGGEDSAGDKAVAGTHAAPLPPDPLPG